MTSTNTPRALFYARTATARADNPTAAAAQYADAVRIAHADYPHTPGYLYDCPGCESRCHCMPGQAECVYQGQHRQTCACGIPNRAAWHVFVILGRDYMGGGTATDTTYTDIYACDQHFPGYPDGSMSDQDIHSLLRWDGHQEWDVIEYHATHLRDGE